MKMFTVPLLFVYPYTVLEKINNPTAKPMNSQTEKYLQATCKVHFSFLAARLSALTFRHWAISGILKHSTLTETSKQDISANRKKNVYVVSRQICQYKPEGSAGQPV